MAVLTQPVSNMNVFAEVIGNALAPAGTYVATIIDIRDEFGVTRQKYQSTETEKVDLTTFLFGFRDQAGNPHKVASRRMKISGADKSALYGFLKSLLGRAPSFGWDYLDLRGRQCLLTVEHVQKRDGSGVFAAIAALSPVPSGFGGQAPVGSLHPAMPVQVPVQYPVAMPPVALPAASLPGFVPNGTMPGQAGGGGTPAMARPQVGSGFANGATPGQGAVLPNFNGTNDPVPF